MSRLSSQWNKHCSKIPKFPWRGAFNSVPRITLGDKHASSRVWSPCCSAGMFRIHLWIYSWAVLGQRHRIGCPCWDCRCPCWKSLVEPLKRAVPPAPHRHLGSIQWSGISTSVFFSEKPQVWSCWAPAASCQPLWALGSLASELPVFLCVRWLCC